LPLADGPLCLLRNVFQNTGDEAMLAAEIAFLRHRFPHLPLHVLTDDPHAVSARYRVSASYSDAALLNPWPSGAPSKSPRILRFLRNRFFLPPQCRRFLRHAAEGGSSLPASQQTLLDTLHRSRLLIAGGGLVPSVSHVETVRRTLLKASSSLQIPYLLHGVSIFRASQSYPPYANAHSILLRDPAGSATNALSCGVPTQKLVDSFDPVFCSPFPQLPAPLTPAEPFAAVCLRSGFSPSQISAIAAQLLQLAEAGLVSRFLLIPFQLHPAASDLPILKRLQSLLGPAAVLSPSYLHDPFRLPALFSRARFTIAARYHAALFSLAAGTPALGLSVSPEYTLKLAGAFQSFRQPAWLLSSPASIAPSLRAILPTVDPGSLRARAAAMSQAADHLESAIQSALI
jgi:polysaccharide pyruvyl transferase WcaK-like protein